MPESQPLAGKVAVVTGAGRHKGIGRYIALALAQDGADVTITGSGRPPDSFPDEEKEIGWRDIESVAEEIRAMGRRALPLVSKASDAKDAQRIADETKRELGRIDILVNNAAAGRGSDRVPVINLEESEWRRVIETNLTGTFLVTKAVAGAIVAQGEGGRIVNISSILGRQAMATSAAYSVTKAGMILLTQALALELAPHKVNVNCICPGLVATSRMDDVTKPGPIRDMVMRTTPLGREGFPEEIGALVAFLSGPDASYITGQTINIDGGRVMS
jgi:NAD(P)-dependent dehydrogenase (short-subunit alcohol dehydrogenase family)